MKILLTGATGFIGARLREELLDRGDELLCLSRRRGPGHPRCQWIEADLTENDLPFAKWLHGVDAAVNAVGIFREGPRSSFEVMHRQMPIALFRACAAARVQRIVQVSALGADPQAREAFLSSKYAADQALLTLAPDAVVVMPSLVFGTHGASSTQLLRLAAMPVVLLPAGGGQFVQPVHVDDVVAALCALLGPDLGDTEPRYSGRLAVVGPKPQTLRSYLQALRQGMGMPPAPEITVPEAVMEFAARLGERLPGALLNRAAWTMLQRGNTADAATLTRLLRRPPRGAANFIASEDAGGLRLRLQLVWLLPLLRLSLALVWIVTGLVSLGLYPVADSYALLARAGVSAHLQPWALYGAAALDVAFGVATLWPQRRLAWRRWLWAVQAALVLSYTAIITVRLPEFWLHPYGPLSKNLPMLAVLLLLWCLDRPEPAATSVPFEPLPR